MELEMWYDLYMIWDEKLFDLVLLYFHKIFILISDGFIDICFDMIFVSVFRWICIFEMLFDLKRVLYWEVIYEYLTWLVFNVNISFDLYLTRIEPHIDYLFVSILI